MEIKKYNYYKLDLANYCAILLLEHFGNKAPSQEQIDEISGVLEIIFDRLKKEKGYILVQH